MKFQKRLFAITLAAVLSSAALFSVPFDISQSRYAAVYAEEQEELPVFSAESGFYGTDLSLTLSAANGSQIYFTTDGSNPSSSSTAQLYNGAITVKDRTSQPNVYSNYDENNSAYSVSRGVGYKKPTFNVDKATVVRAAIKKADGTYGKTACQTYFVTNGNLAKYKNMTVVSLVTDPDNLFNADTGIYVVGNQCLEWMKSSSYNPAKSVWDTDNVTNYFSRGKEWEREADITVFENGTAALKQGMGIRIKGSSTRNGAQKSFNLHARGEYGATKIKSALLPDNYSKTGELIKKYDSISLRSVSEEVRLRDGFAQGLIHNRENITTQAMKPCVVFINGEFWGTYEMIEKLSDYFIESHYGIDKKDVAMVKNGEHEDGPEEEYNSFISFADEYSKKDLTDASAYQKVCDFIDIDTMIEHYAAGLYFGTFDWPNYNYGVWKNTGAAIDGNPYSDGKWRFMSFDFDYTMGATYGDFGGVEGFAYDSFRHMEKEKSEMPTNLFIQLLKNKNFRDKFAAVYCDYANEVLNEKNTNAMVDNYKNNYMDLLAYTQLRWWGFFGGTPESLMAYFRNEYNSKTLSGIRTFFSQRAGYTLEDMKEYTGLKGTLQTISLQTEGKGKIQISSIVPDTSKGIWSGKYYSDCPVTLTAVPDDGMTFDGWGGDVSESGTTITVTPSKAMNIKANFKENTVVKGDVNSDGKFNVSDIVMLQKWMLNAGDITDETLGDMNSDGIINIADLCLMKSELIGK